LDFSEIFRFFRFRRHNTDQNRHSGKPVTALAVGLLGFSGEQQVEVQDPKAPWALEISLEATEHLESVRLLEAAGWDP
jgi:hypothetical protein